VTPRLATGLWVAAYRRRLDLAGIPCMIARRGDATAGAVLVKLATMDGQAVVFQRGWDLASGDRVWTVLTQGDEGECDAALARQAGFDPDIWVVEIEDPRGRHLLAEEGLE
jgi:hypothetical protein